MSDQQEPRRGEIVLSDKRTLALRATPLVERGLRDIARFEEIEREEDLWRNARKSGREFEAFLQKRDAQRDAQWNELYEVVKGGNVDLIKASVKSEPWLLCRAASEGDMAIVNTLLSYNANVEAQDGWGVTALTGAARAGHPEIVALLIRHGADVRRTELHDVFDGELEESAERKMIDVSVLRRIIKLLVDAGAEINAKDEDGNTPLDWALAMGKTEMLSVLRQLGGKPSSEIG